ncbi:MAG: ABC transporter ATP-binding protein/permease [Bacilli bacterium]|nr:ABC transporter ATP-binding protein/permease [Bacilli bacterium]
MPAPKMSGRRNMAPVSKEAKLNSVKRLLGYVFKYYGWQFAIVMVCLLINSAAGSVGSYFVGSIFVNKFISPALSLKLGGTDVNIFTYQPSDMPFNFTTAVVILASIYVLSLICAYSYNVLMSIIGQGVQKRIRDELFEHMQSLPISYFDRRGHGDIMSVYTNDIDALREMLSRALPMVTTSIFTMIVCFFMMLFTDMVLMLVVLAFAAIIFFFTRYFVKQSSHYFVKMQIELGRTNAYIEELTNGQKVVKVFNYEDRNLIHFDEHNEALFQNTTKANRFANVLMPVVNQLGNLQYVVIALVGATFIATGFQNYNILNVWSGGTAFQIGTIVSFLMFSKSFVQPIGQVSQQLNVVALALAGASRIFEMTDAPSEIDEGYVELVNAKEDENGNPVECVERTGRWAWKHPHTNGAATTYTWLNGDITFNDVDFAYIPGKTVLHNITLWARRGQKVAFVGPTGAGKTTITNLINRFYDIEDGKVRYDGINITKIKKSDLRRSLGIVLQDTKLFTGTVKENIRYGNLDATDEEVIEAAKLSNADLFIRNLPNGYDTVLENGGASLSQGQRQLLSIARCAVANPPVMILDEATSSIDSRTEALVQAGMDAIMKGRTVFVIAHRLSTIQNSDVIMVLQNGTIIERGNHEQLLAQKGKYRELYNGKKSS